ncbi:L,D-transpeptidase family protein [Poriferisphaera sp. WC338]|uniref:L,D-transpeptidase n=1 Tax=Poriferisphaera sp. WC338 TaxID=3425129 RepID=UPI003D813D93
MVLGSQSPRDGMSRKYMVSRRRRTRRWPWVVLVGGLVLVGIYLVSSGDDAGPDEAVADGTGAVVDESQETLPVDNGMQLPPRDRMAGYVEARGNGRVQPTGGLQPEYRVPKQLGPVAGSDRVARQIDMRGGTARTVEMGVNREPQQPVDTAPRELPRAVDRGAGKSFPAFDEGMELIANDRPVEGRKVLSRLLFNHELDMAPSDLDAILQVLMSVNEVLVFGKNVVPGDPLTEYHTVQSGEYMGPIANRVYVPYQFLERINGVKANRMQAGRPLKLVKGPFHARVIKHQYRMDIYLEDVDGEPIYVTSFLVGLGEGDSTPIGNWVVEPGRKVSNPGWTNPRTNQTYSRNDPNNPIGEYWIALKGLDATNKDASGYGIHGTNEPDSVGTMASMGCVRMLDKDVKMVYDMLTEGRSTVQILP